ncbi:MAG: DUF362 domain-containing protein [Phycisphaerae bacterium]|nr:DUF362 domain-containing protein [Phycisphaerae bacterium]MDD5381142.1 DUF362 domain-containing protein [Phycisphaerae bacterium]
MNEQNDKKLSRRQLLARAGKAGISIAAAGAIARLLFDAEGPKANVEGEKKVTLKNFSVQQRPGQTISVVKGEDRTATVDKAIELLGGIERFVKAGETVVIKPNVAFATPAMLCATTNPELVAEVVRLCYSRGKAKKVIVTDNPINDPASCFTLSGIGKAASDAGAEVVLPKANLFRDTTLPGGELIKDCPIFFEPFAKADKVIGIAPVKNHHRAGASMTMKNWYGLLGGRRNIFHQDINTIIAELAMMVRPSLVILDGTEVMMTNGPTGGSTSDLKRTNTLIASTDCVAADSYGCTLLDMKVSDLSYLAKAEKAGAGTSDYESLKPLRTEVT